MTRARHDRKELHAHTTCSDGVLSPADLVDLAARCEVTVLAVTDHDTTAGCQAAAARGAAQGVEVVPGIELTCGQGDGELHLLGYFVSPADEALEAAALAIRANRRERIDAMLGLLADHGVELTSLDLAQPMSSSITRSHVARALIHEGHVTDVREAFGRWIGEGRPAYVPKDLLPASEAIALVRAAGGVTVLAHPGRYSREPDLEELVRFGLDGLEVHYPTHTRAQVRALRAFAGAHRLIITGGTDFHVPDPRCGIGSQHLPLDPLPALRAIAAARE